VPQVLAVPGLPVRGALLKEPVQMNPYLVPAVTEHWAGALVVLPEPGALRAQALVLQVRTVQQAPLPAGSSAT